MRIYLDYNAGAPLHPAARAAMADALDLAGNPSSIHADGRRARARLEAARRQIAALFGALDDARDRIERAEIEGTLAVPGMSGLQIADAGRRLNHIAAETAMLEERWLELQSQIEAMTTAGRGAVVRACAAPMPRRQPLSWPAPPRPRGCPATSHLHHRALRR